jgi:hypothetical protein
MNIPAGKVILDFDSNYPALVSKEKTRISYRRYSNFSVK